MGKPVRVLVAPPRSAIRWAIGGRGRRQRARWHILVPVLTIQFAARLYLSFDGELVCLSHTHLRKLFKGTEAAPADSRRLRLLPVPRARGTARAFAREARPGPRRAQDDG